MSTIAERAIGTAFEILYQPRKEAPVPEKTKQELAAELNREKNRENMRQKRAAKKAAPVGLHSLSSKSKKTKKVLRDNKQFANWTI